MRRPRGNALYVVAITAREGVKCEPPLGMGVVTPITLVIRTPEGHIPVGVPGLGVVAPFERAIILITSRIWFWRLVSTILLRCWSVSHKWHRYLTNAYSPE